MTLVVREVSRKHRVDGRIVLVDADGASAELPRALAHERGDRVDRQRGVAGGAEGVVAGDGDVEAAVDERAVEVEGDRASRCDQNAPPYEKPA